MSEKTETVKKQPPPARPKQKKESSGSTGAFLAMVLALGAAGGSYYIWQQHLIAEQDRLVLEESIEQLLEAVAQKDQVQLARIEQLREHRHGTTEQRIGALEQSLPDLSQQISVQQQEWTLAEVDYLLRIAEHRLQLSHDIPTAITALGQAREQLLSYTNGLFNRQIVLKIEEMQENLLDLEQTSPSAISLQLGGLIPLLDELPFAVTATDEKQPAEPPAAVAEEAGTMGKLKHWGRVVWHDIKSLVTIRRTDEISTPAMNPEQRYLLRAQLRMKLETARLAALGQNQPLYHSSLGEALEWLERYYNNSDSQVIESAGTIHKLQALEISPELPSLQGLRQQLHTLRQNNTTLAPPPRQEPNPPKVRAHGVADPLPSEWLAEPEAPAEPTADMEKLDTGIQP